MSISQGERLFKRAACDFAQEFRNQFVSQKQNMDKLTNPYNKNINI